MPKVSKFPCRIDGVSHVISVSYNQEKKFHVTDFPQEVLFIGKSSQYEVKISGFETEKLLKEFLLDAIESYHEKKKRSRKVIIYKLSVSHQLKDASSDSRSREIFERLASTNDNGAAICIDYFLAMEVDHNGLHYHNIDEEGNTTWKFPSPDSDSIVIEWTKEREDGFKEIYSGMERLARRVAEVLTDAKKTQRLLDQKVKLIN